MGLAIVMLTGASVLDIRERRVANLYWLPFAGFALVFTVGDYFVAAEPSEFLIRYGVALALAGLWYVIWRLGAFGGADAKGLMVASFLVAGGPGLLPWVLVAYVNGLAVILLLPAFYLLANIVQGRFAWPFMLLGLRVPVDQIVRRKFVPLQVVRGDGLATKLMTRPGESIAATVRDLRMAAHAEVWATWLIPFMVPLTIGAIAASAGVNVLLWLVNAIG